jgi:hypothetical protein
VSIPRWLVWLVTPVVWLVAIPLAHAALPWALSSFSPRYGWTDGRIVPALSRAVERSSRFVTPRDSNN